MSDADAKLVEVADAIRATLLQLVEPWKDAARVLERVARRIEYNHRVADLLPWPKYERRSRRNASWWRGRKMSEGMRRAGL
jgi:hypothetical protein